MKWLPLLILPCLVQAQSFTLVTATIVDKAEPPLRPFWAGLPDVNGDGCLDAFIGNHMDSSPSALFMQARSNGRCRGTFTQVTSPTQPTPTAPRITSRYQFVNLNNNASGLPCITGTDIDGGSAALYCPQPGALQGDAVIPFAPKTIGCAGTRMMCMPADIDRDGGIEFITHSRVAPNNSGDVKRIGSTTVLYPANNAIYAELLIAMDINNDGFPEIVSPGMGGYWEFKDGLVWVGNRFVGSRPGASTSANHCAPADFDSDGDMDLYCGIGAYNTPAPNVFTSYLWRNDGGTFTNVTAESGIAGLQNTYYFTTYANTVAGDLDNNGFPDLIFAGEGMSHTTAKTRVVLLMNDGMKFTVVRRDFGAFTGAATSSAKAWVNVGDFSNDGKLDIIKTQGHLGTAVDGKYQWEGLGLWQNTTENGNHWITVKATTITQDGLHVGVMVRDTLTGEIVTSGQSGVFTTGYANLRPHLGVGPRNEVNLEVRYPDGRTFKFDRLPTDRHVTIDQEGRFTIRGADRALVEE